MKRYFILCAVLSGLLVLLVLPRAALGNLTPPTRYRVSILERGEYDNRANYLTNTNLPLSVADWEAHDNGDSSMPNAGLPLSNMERGQGGEVIGDGTPESCTEVAFAAALQVGGTITFNCGTEPYTLTLLSPYVVTTTIEIEGGNLITLAKQGANRHFTVSDTGALTLNNLTLKGDVPAGGGGVDIATPGSLTAENVTFTRNAPVGTAPGGAITNAGTVVLTDTRFFDNQAQVGGGALYSGGSARLTDVVVYRNSIPNALTSGTAYGAGIANFGSMTYVGGTVEANKAYQTNPFASSTGGGIFNHGTLSLRDVRFLDNHAFQGSALYILSGNTDATILDIMGNGTAQESVSAVEIGTEMGGPPGALIMGDTEIFGNTRIGLWAGSATRLLLYNSTLASNGSRAMFFDAAGSVYIFNSTISHNNGGIYASATTMMMDHNTIVANGSDHNLELANNSEVQFESTVLADAPHGNCTLGNGTNILQSLGHNLATDNTCELIDPTDIPNQPTILLGGLAYNGGFTATHLPQAGSPLIDHGVCSEDLPQDQRGVDRPYGADCDIGSVERSFLDDATPTPTATVTTTPNSSATPTPTGTLTVTPTGTLTATPTGTPPTFDELLYLPLIRR